MSSSEAQSQWIHQQHSCCTQGLGSTLEEGKERYKARGTAISFLFSFMVAVLPITPTLTDLKHHWFSNSSRFWGSWYSSVPWVHSFDFSLLAPQPNPDGPRWLNSYHSCPVNGVSKPVVSQTSEKDKGPEDQVRLEALSPQPLYFKELS